MVGYRSREFYIIKFGEVEGTERYQRVLLAREARQRRKDTGRSRAVHLDENSVTSGDAVRCEACGVILVSLQWTHFKKCKVTSLDEYRRKYPEAPLQAPSLRRKMAVTLQNMIELYGDIEGQRRWDIYRQKQALTNTFEYKAKTHGWTPSEFEDYNKKRAVTKENLINRYGDIEGTRRWNEYCDRQSYTNTLDYFIEREGNEADGVSAWLLYNQEKGKSRRPHDIAETLNISLDDACAILAERTIGSAYVSGIERSFIDQLEEAVGSIRYTFKTRQFCVWSHEADCPFMYDVCCSKRKKVIEFNGDYWHARPGLYNADFLVSQSGMTAEQIWQRDAQKRQAIEDRGFRVLTVWESDFLKNGIAEVVEWWTQG